MIINFPVKRVRIFPHLWNLRFTLISLFILCNSVSTLAQNSNEEILRLQRAIFIFNFAQQVAWDDLDSYETFKIGVLGPDRTIIDIQSLSQRRRIYNKPITTKRFQRVKDVDDIQILYVHNKYNFDINYILKKISGKKILLITEDYNYNSSMINMVQVDSSFEYEVNENLLQRENFKVGASLNKFAISSAEKWKALYQASITSLEAVENENEVQQEALEKERDEVKGQKEKISSQEREINFNKEDLFLRDKWLDRLWIENELQKKKYDDKVLIERALEENIKQQVNFIHGLNAKIDSSSNLIETQKEFLANQDSEIAEKDIILNKRLSEIKRKNLVNWLLAALLLSALILSVVIYRSYILKKKLNENLETKNAEISSQSIALSQKNSELEQFAFIASHDLKEPLNSISSLIDVLKEDYGDSFDSEGTESIKFIKNSSDRMRSLVDGLLEYSRLGKTNDYEMLDCNQIVLELKSDLNYIISETNASVECIDLPKIYGSEIELRLVFQNLINNAIKFVHGGVNPVIEISCEEVTGSSPGNNDYWQFSVQDNGIGIADKYHERIFSIFQRLHSRDRYEGTGIGLAHCKKIVESHGGKIWLESEETVGSIFHFTIPVQK